MDSVSSSRAPSPSLVPYSVSIAEGPFLKFPADQTDQQASVFETPVVLEKGTTDGSSIREALLSPNRRDLPALGEFDGN